MKAPGHVNVGMGGVGGVDEGRMEEWMQQMLVDELPEGAKHQRRGVDMQGSSERIRQGETADGEERDGDSAASAGRDLDSTFMGWRRRGRYPYVSNSPQTRIRRTILASSTAALGAS